LDKLVIYLWRCF